MAPVRYAMVPFRDALYELGQALVDIALVPYQFRWRDEINERLRSNRLEDYADAGADVGEGPAAAATPDAGGLDVSENNPATTIENVVRQWMNSAMMTYEHNEDEDAHLNH